MPIRYKVVQKDRTSVTAKGKYSRKYQKGSTIKAEPNTYGLFVFRRKTDADSFSMSDFTYFTIKVKTRAEHEKIPGTICGFADEDSLNFFYHGLRMPELWPPEGTICVKELEVLE